jgi:hypothetical protein
LLKSHAAIDEWQTQMRLKPMALGSIQLYSTGLEEAQHALTGIAAHRVGASGCARQCCGER